MKVSSAKEIACNNLAGKIAEAAFGEKMKWSCGIDAPLDSNFHSAVRAADCQAYGFLSNRHDYFCCDFAAGVV